MNESRLHVSFTIRKVRAGLSARRRTFKPKNDVEKGNRHEKETRSIHTYIYIICTIHNEWQKTRIRKRKATSRIVEWGFFPSIFHGGQMKSAPKKIEEEKCWKQTEKTSVGIAFNLFSFEIPYHFTITIHFYYACSCYHSNHSNTITNVIWSWCSSKEQGRHFWWSARFIEDN